MKRITLLLILLSAGLSGYSTTVVIHNSGFTFTPDEVTINFGDTISFEVNSIHHPREVSEATWNANGNTALSGGFETPAGGGLVLPDKLGVGTHFYVCIPHASGGMKGKIIVQAVSATKDIHFPAAVSIYPNPSNGRIQVVLDNSDLAKNYNLDVYNILGTKVYSRPKSEFRSTNEIDLSNFNKGVYFIKLSDGREIYTKKILIQ